MVASNKTNKILIVDDDRVTLKLISRKLGEKGFDVVSEEAADAGLQKAMNEKYDLIILDVMMPVINGFNICRLLKADERCKKIPVILLSIRAEKSDFAIGEEVGADAYFTKPVHIHQLLEKITVLLK